MILRVDDYSENTKKDELSIMVGTWLQKFPDSEVMFAVSPISRFSLMGSVYPCVPFKGREKQFYYTANQHLRSIHYDKNNSFNFVIWASHGLIHINHSRLSKDAQEMSILTSCSIVDTKIFVPPFNDFNETTEVICKENGITLIKPDGWKSLEHNEVSRDCDFWYMHAWRWTPEEFERKLK